MSGRPNHRRHKPRQAPPARRAGITVITPALPDRGVMLAEAIMSVNAQTLPPYAHLISVDHDHRGPGVMINRLAHAAETEWLSILADDDLYDPDHLQTLHAVSAEADIVMSWCRIEGSPERHETQYRGDFHPYDLRNRQDTGMRGTFMFRRSLWEKLGGWPETPMDDWLFLTGAIDIGASLAPVYRETWTYRWHGTNLSEIIGALGRGERPSQMYYLAQHL